MVLEDVAVEHERDPERDDRERDAVEAQGGQADDDPQREGGCDAGGHCNEVVGVEARDHHAGGVRADSGKRRLAQRDLTDIAREQHEAEQAEGPDDRERGVELESDVEADRDAGQDRKRDQRDRDAHHQSGGHFVATAVNPRGLRTTSTARITSSAMRRGKPRDWIQIVG